MIRRPFWGHLDSDPKLHVILTAHSDPSRCVRACDRKREMQTVDVDREKGDLVPCRNCFRAAPRLGAPHPGRVPA